MGASVLIGQDISGGFGVAIPSKTRQYSLYAIGTTGMGKSTLLENIAFADMASGDGLCFLDPHEDSAETLIRLVPQDRQADVIFWDPTDDERPFGINPFYCAREQDYNRTADHFITALGSL